MSLLHLTLLSWYPLSSSSVRTSTSAVAPRFTFVVICFTPTGLDVFVFDLTGRIYCFGVMIIFFSGFGTTITSTKPRKCSPSTSTFARGYLAVVPFGNLHQAYFPVYWLVFSNPCRIAAFVAPVS